MRSGAGVRHAPDLPDLLGRASGVVQPVSTAAKYLWAARARDRHQLSQTSKPYCQHSF